MTPFPMIYAAVPRIACKCLCSASCGPIQAYPRERAYFESKTGKPFPGDVGLIEALTAEHVPTCPRLCRDCGHVHKPWLACEPKTDPMVEPSRHRGGRPRKTPKPLPVLRAHEMRKESR